MQPEKTDIGRRWPELLRALQRGAGGEEESLGLLRLASSIGLFFLLLYFVVDWTIRSGASRGLHLLVVVGTAGFMILTWTPFFRRFRKLWAFAVCIFIMAMFLVISAATGDPESRMIAIILCPLATASFVAWSPRWQLAMSGAALLAYAIAGILIPATDHYNVYRWLGLLGAIELGESTAIFIDRYRQRIRTKVEALEAATRFREREIATLAHDIRNPLSALAGYVELLEEPSVDPSDRDQMISRIGSTAWNTNLVVSNVLDLYRMEEGSRIHLSVTEADPNLAIAEAADDCAAQARRVGVELRCDLARLPYVQLEPRNLERIVRNLAAVPLSRACRSAVRLRTEVAGNSVAIEIDAPGTRMTPAELEQMMENPRSAEHPAGAGKIGLYLARATAEAAGGALTVRLSEPTGVFLRVELPCLSTRPSAGTIRKAG